MPVIPMQRRYGIMAALTTVILLGGLAVWLTRPVPEPPSLGEHNVPGSYKALSLWADQRTYPGVSLPERAHYAAFVSDQQRAHLATGPDAQTPAWEPIGPHNGGGRTLALAFNPENPKTLYAGAASGGLWRSYTAGLGPSAWERVSTGFPVLGVSSIAFAPGDSSTLFIGTGEVYNVAGSGTGAANRAMRGTYGIGILKSEDGGQTWQKSLDWSANQERGVNVVRLNPLNPKTVWAGTTEGTYQSLDGGATWTRLHNVVMVTDLVIHPEDTSRVLIAAGNFGSAGHGLYLTTDGGQSWQKRTGGLPQTFEGKAMLGMAPSDPNIIYASIGNGFTPFVANATWLCRSDDAGDTWRIVSTEDYAWWQGWYSHDVEVHPDTPNELMAAGVMMWKSIDGGTTIQQKSSFDPFFAQQVPAGAPEGPPTYMHGDTHAVVYHPTDPNQVYFANDGGVWRSTTRGETFEGLNGGYQTTQFYTGFDSSQQDSALAIGGLQDNVIYIYKGTTDWSKLHLFVGRGDGAWTAVDPRNDQVLYASLQFLRLHKSFDGGQTWTSVAPPEPGATTFIAPFVLGVDNPDVLYGGRAIVYKSNAGGFAWSATNGGQPLDGNPAFAMAISHQTSDVVYVATAPFFTRAGVFRTTDGGETWTNITGPLPDRYPTNLAVDPHDDQRLYLTFGGFGTAHVFTSVNGGETWQALNAGLPDVPASAILVDPLFPDHVYLGNDLGVYASTDRGQTWQRFSEGLPEAVLTVDFSLSGTNRKLRVATHGNGVYERDLLGRVLVSTETETAPASFALAQNYPNPFTTETTIGYTLHEPAAVTVQLYNSRGQAVRTLVRHALQRAGRYEVRWDGRDDTGLRVAAGVYFYRLRAGAATTTRKLVLR